MVRKFASSAVRVAARLCLGGALLRAMAGLFPACLCGPALANPTGMSVVSGSATASQSGSRLTITTSQLAYLNWQTFNIAAGETTVFKQPSISSIVVNRVTTPNPSQIFGNLLANGVVVLMNSSGIYFGPNSYVKTGGLIASTANCAPPPPTGGGSWQFNGPPPLSSIINYGKIDVAPGGPAYLIAENVFNYGSINAPGGDIGLAAGQQVVLSQRPDGRGFSMQVNLPEGSVDNEGHITADAGTIAMNAQTVNQNGLVQANSARNVKGVIELVASDGLNLGANSQILANGDASAGGSPGGTITLKSGGAFSDSVGSQIDATGGSQGGNGGNIEISAPDILSLDSTINAGASPGWSGGLFSLDPNNIVLGSTGGTSGGTSGTINESGSGSSTYYVNVNTAFQNITAGNILLEASGYIYVGDGTVDSSGNFNPIGGVTWDLTGSTGGNITGGLLTLEAGKDIDFVDGSLITDENDWSVSLLAGVNNFTTGTVQPGAGNIYLNGGAGQSGSGSIQTAQGSINLTAGQDIIVGSGSVITTAGGSIEAHALAGDIDTGSDAHGYFFVQNAGSVSTAYNLSDGLGGISTAAGGNVTLIAGGNVTSILPGSGVYYYDGSPETPENLGPSGNSGNDYLTAGSGAYGGSVAGNVTIVAGGNVTGHYLVADGIGSIYAGVEMDANGNPVTDASGNYVLGATGSAGTDSALNALALSLINGGWNVDAAQDIYLQEVRNPNGFFDFNGGSRLDHLFNYAPADFVDLSAGDQVQLGAPTGQLPRLPSQENGTGPNDTAIIYPSILNITAGDGGVIFGTGPGSPESLILFPSAQGSLTIDTSGPLEGLAGSLASPQLFNLIVSDAPLNQDQYNRQTSNFGIADDAPSPIHADSSTPIFLNVGGNMDEINLIVPEAAQINVGGDMLNCAFEGMNLAASTTLNDVVTEANGSTLDVTWDPSVTSINVAGDIFNRGQYTSVNLSGIAGAQDLNLSYLSEAISAAGQPSAAELVTSFFYDPATETLTYKNITGVSLSSVLQMLNNLTVQEYINGVPQYQDPPFDTIPISAPNPVSVFGNPNTPGTAAYALLSQFNQLGPIPGDNVSVSFGYTIGGGGQFNVTARSIDLGTSSGIQSLGAAENPVRGAYPLASLFGDGGVFNQAADVTVTATGNHSEAPDPITGDLSGDIDMYSSSIASLNGGNVSVFAGGDVNAGSSVFNVNTLSANGIYTSGGGNVSVIATGNVNVNGSRIVTYDGGNVTVESLTGDVNAGSGNSLPVGVTGYYEDPSTHTVYSDSPQIPFSGILALTFPPDSSYPEPAPTLGNILVETPNGNVVANAAGILQIALNGLDYPNATSTVLAGYDLNNGGSPEFTLDNQNIVTFGATSQLNNDGQQVSVTLLLDADGMPVLDANGNQIYVENLGPKGGALITYSVVGGKISINPDVDAAGEPISVVTLTDSNGKPITYANGNPEFVLGRNIDVNGSGLIASNAKLLATGNINGLIFARDNLDINAQQNVNVTALAVGVANVSGASVSGTIAAVGGVNVSGASISASLISANVSGATSGQSGLGVGTAANAASQALANNQVAQAAANSAQDTDDQKKKKGKEIALAQKVSRVTVILPPKKVSEIKTSTDHT